MKLTFEITEQKDGHVDFKLIETEDWDSHTHKERLLANSVVSCLRNSIPEICELIGAVNHYETTNFQN